MPSTPSFGMSVQPNEKLDMQWNNRQNRARVDRLCSKSQESRRVKVVDSYLNNVFPEWGINFDEIFYLFVSLPGVRAGVRVFDARS